MCGIVLARSYDDAKFMLQRLIHRGHDDQRLTMYGYGSSSRGWTIGQNRLSILHHGWSGSQPYVSSTGITVFNGELYNYVEVAKRLKKVELGSEIGVLDRLMAECSRFDRILDGDFAIIRIAKHGDVILSRDLIGVVPLYYQMEKKRLVRAASEKKACPGDWLEVKAGETLTFDREGRLKKRVQFDPYSLHLEPPDIGHVERLFRHAVSRRIIHAEVPITIALSGGLDSSLVVMAASQFRKNLTAITVAMDKNSDEVQNAVRLAAELKVEHRVVAVTQEEIAMLRDAMKHTLEDPKDNPVKWRGFVRNYFVAKHAPGIVILCGEGADEIACGYDSHQRVSGLSLEWKSLSTVRSMPAINLDRVNKGGMAWTKEFRVPFLDRALVLYMLGCFKLPNKGLLRMLALKMGIPDYIMQKPKYGPEERALEATR